VSFLAIQNVANPARLPFDKAGTSPCVVDAFYLGFPSPVANSIAGFNLEINRPLAVF
jgi:hypothetical protein